MRPCRSPGARTVFHQVPRPLGWRSGSASASGGGPGRGRRNQQPCGFDHALRAGKSCRLLQRRFPRARALGRSGLSTVCLDKDDLWVVLASDQHAASKLPPAMVPWRERLSQIALTSLFCQARSRSSERCSPLTPERYELFLGCVTVELFRILRGAEAIFSVLLLQPSP